MSRDNERLDHSGHSVDVNDALRTSNLTSGHFLGTVPREWMLGGSDGQAAGTTNQSSKGDTAQKTTTSIANTSAEQVSSGRPRDVQYSFISSPVTEGLPQAHVNPAVCHQNVHTIRFDNNGLTEGNSRVYPTPEPPSTELEQVASHSTRSPVPASNVPTRLGPIHPVMSPHNPGNPIPWSSFDGNNSQVGPSTDTRVLTHDSPPSLSDHAARALPPTSSSITPSSFPRGRPRKHPRVEVGPPETSESVSRRVSAFNNIALPQASTLTLDGHVQAIDARFSLIAAQNALGPVDQMRIAALRAACTSSDTIYIMLHQLSCLESNHPDILRTYLQLSSTDVSSLVALNDILADNRKLSIEVLAWFCQFPVPLKTFSTNESYQSDILKAKYILGFFAPRWEILKGAIFARRLPPCAREIAELLVYDSPMLSQAIFSYYLCRMFPRTLTSISERALKIFRKSQEAYYTSVRQSAAGTQPVLTRDQELQVFVRDFQDLAKAHNQHISGNLRQLPSGSEHPLLPSPATSPSVDIPPRLLHNTWRPDRPQDGISYIGPTGQAGPLMINSIPNHVRLPNGLPAAVTMTGSSRFFPSPGQILPITINPDPNRSALHQAHLSTRVLSSVSSSPSTGASRRLYAFLERFLDQPKLIDQNTVFETWTVSIPCETFGRWASERSATKSNPLGRSTQEVSHKSIVFHLRCFQISSEPLNEAECSATPTFWPEHLFISINGHHLEFRRKTLHGRDLPVEISHFLNEGSNEFRLSYHANTRDMGKTFAVVLEVITFWEHQPALELPEIVPAGLSLSAITKSLHAQDTDDDVVMADAHVSIDLIDPFTARIFDRPVRGRMCRHRECFDFEAFLQSRNCRFKDNVVQPDEWKCPLCGKDARPSTLLEDAFLLEVKAKLKADGKSDTKAILVKKDNTWEGKVGNAAPLTNKADTTHQKSQSRSTSAATNAKAINDRAAAEQTSEIVMNDPEVIDLALDSDDEASTIVRDRS